ncbi:prolyl oligopeptidase family serine peptidase [Streptomyces sp. DSM 41982]|uniref:Prolyl oligopeptidase family serine peptidase n=1 Tax=Streptomyces evansiae TaxID=3075535 RepID=A0ABD5E9E3_9ACTN|nr:prolyl oligopeptidase family serine peptidase [Streptomyces sp. DSM 41982]MDT0417671.1 prolyl oligopeptidase family serine peptidase [Streptomyces sp. DSM 41982]
MTPTPPTKAQLRAFPEQFARSARFSRGRPHSFSVADDGRRVLFLRSASGTDAAPRLWLHETGPAAERPLTGAGITAYTADARARRVVVALPGGTLAALDTGTPGPPRPLPGIRDAKAPRLAPGGERLAFVRDGALHVVRWPGGEGAVLCLVAPEGPDVTYGLPDLVARGEIGREEGYWWAPDGATLLVARTDESGVARRWLGDPAHPERPPRALRYPAAGTANAVTSLHLVAADGGGVRPVALPGRADEGHPEAPWHAPAFEYLTAAGWDAHGPWASVQTRDQRTVRTLALDPADGSARPLAEEHDPYWVSLLPGAPLRTDAGTLVTARVLSDGTRGLAAGTATTPEGLQVREVLGARGEEVLLRASTDPTEVHVWAWTPGTAPTRLSGPGPGVYEGAAGGPTLVLDGLGPEGRTVRVTGRAGGAAAVDGTAGKDRADGAAVADGRGGAGGTGGTGGAVASRTAVLRSLEEIPLVLPRPRHLRLGSRALRSTLYLPSWHTPGTPLPVLLSPYAGHGLGLVVRARTWWAAVAQWFAEHGFAVLITDGRGTPGRGAPWEYAIHGDRLTAALADQADALRAAADAYPDLDPGRVGIRGWSYGGYLAAAAVLRHPETFHAAVAGAAPSDRALYHTHWEERFLGDPAVLPEGYRASSLLDDAPRLRRPLLLVHGLADENVSPAHMLRLSAALLAAGRPHEVLPLSGAGHGVAGTPVAAALLRHEVRWLGAALGVAVEDRPGEGQEAGRPLPTGGARQGGQ